MHGAQFVELAAFLSSNKLEAYHAIYEVWRRAGGRGRAGEKKGREEEEQA
jgi:hypothetical protein